MLLIAWSLVEISAATDIAAGVNLEWNANPEANIAGYRVQYGTTSGNLNRSLTVGTSPAATLSDLEPGTRHYCAIRAFNTSGLEGPLSAEVSFIIPVATAPEITVSEPDGGLLADAAGTQEFGGLYLATTGEARTYTLRNSGTAELTGLAISTGGPDAADFIVSSPAATSLPPGSSTTLRIAFRPSAAGTRTATLQIASNDPGTSSFDIALRGSGITIPILALENADGTPVKSGDTVATFGSVIVGTTGNTLTYVVRNTGSATLSGLSVASGGRDFKVGNLGSTSLPPGARTTFKVSFRPRAAGTRSTQLVIASNDADEKQFMIALVGKGIEVPEIRVELSSGKSLTDDEAFINFGTVAVGSTAKSLVLTIRNSGNVKLSGLAIIKNGINSSEFGVSALRTRSLAPGASTTFKVNFRPAKSGIRWAAIHITSNDPNESPFDIILTGTGRKSSASAPATKGLTGIPVSPTSPPIKGVAVIGGRKYLTLTILKTPGSTTASRDFEVSSNLVDWSSGKRHTTVLLDNATTLKVRDNTPVTRDAKRYIRLKR